MSLILRRGTRHIWRAAICLTVPAIVAGFLSAVAPASALTALPASGEADPAAYVNPMIGTGNGGAEVGSVNEFPGPDAPFGMIQWGPNTTVPSDVPWGYYYPESTLTGFSLTRLGGVGCTIFQDFEFQPTTDAVTESPGTTSGWNSYSTGFSHSQETAQAGYYSVTGDDGIQTQLTTGTRAALGRFTYPAGSPATMLINASSSYGNKGSTLRIVSPDTIVGSTTGGGFCDHNTQRYTVYFAVTFDHPFTSWGTWQAGTTTAGGTSVSGDNTGGWASFGTASSGPTVIGAKVAISYVSVAGAQSNQATISTNFDTVRAQTYQEWNQLLGEISVSGGTAAEETTFYTALYHALLDPSIYSDADGQYMGFDFKVHTVPKGHAAYTNFSGWDIYRSEVPLLALLAPKQTSDMMQSLVNDAAQGGWLPKWPTATVYTGMMGGDSADPIIADAYAFGARDFDVNAALEYMLKGAGDTTSPPGQDVYVPRSDYISNGAYNDYLDEGYVPTGSDSATFGTSLTEEYAIDDFTIGQFAAATGHPATAAAFATRGQNWQNVFDPPNGYVMPRGPEAPTAGDPATQEDGFEEGDAAQYTWMVPQNLSALFAALGGDSAAASRLDTFFTQLDAGQSSPYDWAGNEITLDSPWEYDYLGEPWQTQDVVREIITQLYGPAPGGEPGNDDLGAMSSWYVWAALGLYPETPGTSTLVLGSPLFPHAAIHLGDGHVVTINAPQAAAGAPYVQNLTVNGRAWTKNYLPASAYRDGATLDYTLATTPDTTRGTSPQDAPPSYAQGEVPAIGFTTPWGAATATAGATTTVDLGAQSVVQRPQTVRWTVIAPSGIDVTPSSGTLTLDPGQQRTQPVSIGGIAASLPAGQYPVTVNFTEAGRHISTADLYVQVVPPTTAGT
jgi:predicted alpha-1,2-mannosidase